MYVVLGAVLALCALGTVRIRALRNRDQAGVPGDAGASAVDWAVISAILVTAAVIIGGIVYNAVQTKGNVIQQCANQGANAAQC
ncbi:MAG: hypothetical protein ACQSGP_24550 [Frankia sp.]